MQIFGNIGTKLHLQNRNGLKYRGSDMKISKIYIEGDIVINYQFTMQQRSAQKLQFGFITKPSIEILVGESNSDFPLYLFDRQFSDPIDWLEVVLANLLESRGIHNMVAWNLVSPFGQ